MLRRPLAAIALLALCLPVSAIAADPATCPDGTYFVDGPPIFPVPTANALRDSITLDHGKISIASGCEAVPATIHKARDGSFFVRAAWRQCSQAWRVHLKARIAPGCGQMSGVVSSARPEQVRRFIATPCNDPAGCPPLCQDNSDCPDWGYCAKPAGACSGNGKCTERPGICPDVWLPVCGCDGRTYSNECSAAAAGANVAHDGTCEQRCDAAHPCAPGGFCELPTGVCASNLDAGICVDVPDICPNDICGHCDGPICPLIACPVIYQPVCGCDGVTYASECERRKAAVSKSHDGACECAPIPCAAGTQPVDRDGDGCPDTCVRVCGGFPGFPCASGEVCDLPPGTCSSADLFGVCKPASPVCPMIYDPVCGCDGHTYSNDCVRLAAGAQLDHRGECKP